MANVLNGVETLPKISIPWVGRTNVTDRQTDRRHKLQNQGNAASNNDKNVTGAVNENSVGKGMGARRHGQEGALAPSGNVVKCFLCISSYGKTLSRRIIYALFSQPVVGFWGLGPQSPTWAPSLVPLEDFRSQTHNLPTPGKKYCGRPWEKVCF